MEPAKTGRKKRHIAPRSRVATEETGNMMTSSNKVFGIKYYSMAAAAKLEPREGENDKPIIVQQKDIYLCRNGHGLRTAAAPKR
jgi:hypothetical protein